MEGSTNIPEPRMDGSTNIPEPRMEGSTNIPEPRMDGSTNIPEPRMDGSTNIPEPRMDGSTNIPEPRMDGSTNIPEPRMEGSTNIPEPRMDGSTNIPEPRMEGSTNIPEPRTVKYGELVVVGHNGDETRMQSHFALCRRIKANGLKPAMQMARPQVISMDQHQISYDVSKVIIGQVSQVVVSFIPDKTTDMWQIGRSTASPIDFVVRDTVPKSVEDTISRFACRIICQRSPPYTARIYAGGFDSFKNIILGEKAVKWVTESGHMDGLTTNGVMVMHPLNGSTQDSKWREISVCGDTYTLRKKREQRGRLVNNEPQELVDGSMIDLCGVTLMWRTPEGLASTPTMEPVCPELYDSRPWLKC